MAYFNNKSKPVSIELIFYFSNTRANFRSATAFLIIGCTNALLFNITFYSVHEKEAVPVCIRFEVSLRECFDTHKQ